MAISIKTWFEATVDDLRVPKTWALLLIPIQVHAPPPHIPSSPSSSSSSSSSSTTTTSHRIPSKKSLRKPAHRSRERNPLQTPSKPTKKPLRPTSKPRRATSSSPPLSTPTKWSRHWTSRHHRAQMQKESTDKAEEEKASASPSPCPLARLSDRVSSYCPVQRGCRRAPRGCRR